MNHRERLEDSQKRVTESYGRRKMSIESEDTLDIDIEGIKMSDIF